VASPGLLIMTGAGKQGSSAWSALTSASGNLTLNNAGFSTTFNQTSPVNWTWANTTAATSGTSQYSPIFNINGQYWNGSASATDSWTIQDVVANGTNGASTLTFSHSGSSGMSTFKIVGNNSAASNSQAILEVHAGGQGPFVASFFNDSYSAQFAGLRYYVDNSGQFFQSTGSSSTSLNFATTAYNGTDLTITGGKVKVGTVLLLGSADTGLSRISAGVLAIGNGTAGDTTGNLQLNLITKYAGVATVSNGVPAEYATVDLTGQSAAIAATTLYAVPASGAGLYRISFYAKITTPASATSNLGGTSGFQVTFTDPSDSTVPTVNVTDVAGQPLGNNTTTTVDAGSVVIAAKASTNIQYAFDYSSSGLTAMVYKLSIKLEFLG
jgi:hypothetical protein